MNAQVSACVDGCVADSAGGQQVDSLVHGKALGNPSQIDLKRTVKPDLAVRQQLDLLPLPSLAECGEGLVSRQVPPLYQLGSDGDVKSAFGFFAELYGLADHLPCPGVYTQWGHVGTLVEPGDITFRIVIPHHALHALDQRKSLAGLFLQSPLRASIETDFNKGSKHGLAAADHRTSEIFQHEGVRI